ncbi:hypothetical protein K438DRAFT_1966060 [Mycena galopus ATCC 62051]|nr:hypothetical protein K438DRAFT_1966060 [Mycena galopus ATCC 62051]
MPDLEARICLFRERADVKGSSTVSKSRQCKVDDDLAHLVPAAADLEHLQNAIAAAVRTAKKTEPVETERSVTLAPSPKDLKPWNAELRTAKPGEEEADEKRKRDIARKLLPEVQARLTRESSERARAMELIRRKQHEIRGSETPSSVQGGGGGGYSDVFNRREVVEVHRGRERRYPRRW